jgi:hypothetical protein
MGNSLWRAGLCALALLASAPGCSGSAKKDGNGDEPGPGATTCAAGASRCEGLNVKVCSADGTSESIQATCLPPQSCSDGACRETACVPNTKFCKDGAVWKCDSTGGGSTLSQPCAAGTFCREADHDASCSNQACSANEPMCDGNVATACQIDGSGPKPGGTDCAATKQACYQGQCRDQACESGIKVCQHDDVYLCAENGTATSLLADCRDDEVCDGLEGACRTKVCTPGEVSCDGSRIVTCNDFGSAWLAATTDCAASSQLCVAGSCREQVCVPNSTFCQERVIYACDSVGTSSTLSQGCNSWQHCVQYNNYAYCESNQCQPGAVVCDGNVVKTCTKDNTLPSTGTPCGDDNYCVNGQCKPRGCKEGQYLCQNGNVYYCDYSGPSLQWDCPADTACKPTTDGATCEVLPCDPGSSACLANKVGTCATDGQSLSKVTEDCAAGSNICTPDLKCGKSAVDTLGVAENVEGVSAGTFIGDVVNVTSARKLTEISLNLVLAGPRELRWVVYEQTEQAFVARVDKVVSNVSGSGFLSSGPFNYTLKAGRRYAFGAVISGGDGVAYFDTAPFLHATSFGSLVGRVNGYYQSVLDLGYLYTEYAYQIKVTTEVP